MSLCKYKHIFGREREGIHRYRLFGLAIVDVLGTVLGGLLIARLFRWPYTWTVIGCFVAGMLLHALFCVETTLNTLVGRFYEIGFRTFAS